MSDPLPAQLIVPLKEPIELRNSDGEVVHTVKEFTLRTKVCAGDMRGIPIRAPMYTEDLLKMIERVSGQPTKVIDKLGIDDFDKIGEIVHGFFRPSQAGEPDSGPTSGGKPASP